MQDTIAFASQTISSPNFEPCSNFTAATGRGDVDLTEGSLSDCLEVEPGHASRSTSDLDAQQSISHHGFDNDPALSMVQAIPPFDDIFPPSPPHSDPSYKRHIPLPVNHRSFCSSADSSHWSGPMWSTCLADATIGESHEDLPMDQDSNTVAKSLLELKLLPSPPLSPDGNSDLLPSSNPETTPPVTYELKADASLWPPKDVSAQEDMNSIVQSLGMLELHEPNTHNMPITGSPEPLDIPDLPSHDMLVDSTQPSDNATMPRGNFYSPPLLPLEPLDDSFGSLLTEEPLSIYDSHNPFPTEKMSSSRIFSDREVVRSPEVGYSPDLIDDYIHGIENDDGLDRDSPLSFDAPCSPSRRSFCSLPDLDDTSFRHNEPQYPTMSDLSPPSTPRQRLSKLPLLDDLRDESPFLTLDTDTDKRDYNRDSPGILETSPMFGFENDFTGTSSDPQFSPPSPSLSASSSRSSFSCSSPLTSPTSPTSPIDLSEELRLRTIYSQSLETQRECKEQEHILTDYIARLNGYLTFMTSSPLSRNDISSSSSSSDPWLQNPSTEGPSMLGPSEIGELSPLFLSSYEDTDSMELTQARIQQAAADRAELKKKRKKEKERSRELAALLKIKTGSGNSEEASRVDSGRISQSPLAHDNFDVSTPGGVPLSDVPTPGSGFGQDGILGDGGLLLIHSPPSAPATLTPDASHLVAKMIMRRQSMAVRPLSKATKEKEQTYTPSLLSGDKSPRDKFQSNVRKSKSLTNGLFR